MATKFPSFSQGLAQDPTTRRIWYGIATAHDFESHDGMTEERLYQKLFSTHFGHLAVIGLWVAGNLFHIAWQGNFEQWVADPQNVRPIAHAIWDPHFGQGITDALTQAGASRPVNLCYSGLYHWWYTIGMRTNTELYQGAIWIDILVAWLLFGGWLHLQPRFRPSLAWFKNAEAMMNHHLAVLFGFTNIAWTAHLIHVAIPESRGQHVGWDNWLSVLPHPEGLTPFFTGNWGAYAQNPDSLNQVFGTSDGAGTAILTFLGGVHPQSGAIWLTDIAHHHLAIGVLMIIGGHMYRNGFGIGHTFKEITDGHNTDHPNDPHKNGFREKIGHFSLNHNGISETINNSLHFQLGLALACLGTASSLVAHHMGALPSYAFIAQDYTTQAALYTHHQYIAIFLMCGAFSHGAIFFVRDYDPEANKNNALARVLETKEALISHLSWVCMLLGFHTLALYLHNDVVIAFGTPEKQILVEPIFAQFLQAASGKVMYGIDVLLANSTSAATMAANGMPGDHYWMDLVNASPEVTNFMPIGPGDFLVHHGIALGLHTTALILIKGALDARGSKLMPDKKDFGYSFPCDGPGRGGTCDISAWDSTYMAIFWALNTIAWATYYWHWKHLAAWQGNMAQFNESSTHLMGWFRDYLWLNSSQIINGYNPFGINNLSPWAFMFLAGHLVWATGFMFLISWRGYWQELIETLVWAHQRSPIANLVGWRDKPVALSIVQARLVGVTHFAVGNIFTFGAFVIASTSSKFG